MKPAIIGLGTGGLLLLIIVIYVIYCLCTNNVEPLDRYQIITILLVFTIALTLHGLAYNYAEVSFNFNPLTGNYGN